MNSNVRNIIFDASALIALATKEKGYENIKPYLNKAMMSTVNVSEVLKRLVEGQDMTKDECLFFLKVSSILIQDFSFEQALVAAEIRNTKKYGISFADRACISLAQMTGCSVLTCDRAWQELDLDVKFIYPR